ncbi:MAG TPA: porin, partial [Methylophilaceae bacterium]|nr:porin [Methylophilaceae bacterium]
QNDLDIAFQFTFFTGVNSGTQTAAGNNTLNIRQAYMTFGDKSWGTIKAGRDLGIFGSDAILSDMTLLGVGVGQQYNLENSTLGRIGSGYIYADWVGQISYASPNWNGFSFAVGVREPWSNGAAGHDRNDMGFEGKVSYEWAGDYAGKVWAGFVSQKHDGDDTVTPAFLDTDPASPTFGLVVPAATTTFDSYTSRGWEIGAKTTIAGFGLVGYYYEGDGLDSQANALGPFIGGLQFLGGQDTDDEGGYVQATYVLPGIGTKLGASWGISRSESDVNGGFDIDNESWIIGAYHPLTKSLNLVAEYTDQEIEDDDSGFDGEAKTLSLGAILFF